MGFKGVSFGSLIILLVIFILLFGTKKLRDMGGDIGAAVKSFRKGMQEDDTNKLKED